ncbi:MAG: type III pantothenate kinase [Clostridium sp.]|nr:type III pantothenate kinase [Clostridium sp.]
MAYNLTVDLGNTAAKVAVWSGSELKALTIVEQLSALTISDVVSKLDGPVEAAIFCSVTRPGEEIAAMLEPFVGKVIHLTSTLPLPIKIDYGTPGTLGEDRIAAAAGAYMLYPGENLLVVDAGTCVTFDAVTPDGRFAGGNIAPGTRMRLQALHHFTARLPELEMPRSFDRNRLFGNDTRSAMILGTVYGIVGSIAYYRSRMPRGTRVILTGGWASALVELCDFPVEVDADLASKGLNSILLYNETK